MPTALMENLLENDGLKVVDKKNKFSRGHPDDCSDQGSGSNVADDDDGDDVRSSGDEGFGEDEGDGNGEGGAGDDEEEEMEDEEDEVDDDDDDPKIPKKTEIFEGKVVQVEKLVK